MKTKYFIGDKVYILYDNRIYCQAVKGLNYSVYDDHVNIEYQLCLPGIGFHTFPERACYPSRESLLCALSSDVNEHSVQPCTIVDTGIVKEIEEYLDDYDQHVERIGEDIYEKTAYLEDAVNLLTRIKETLGS